MFLSVLAHLAQERGGGVTENEITYAIIGFRIEAQRALGGPGLLEGVYEEALAWELQQSGFAVERQVCVPVRYKGHVLATPLRLDLLVEGKVIVECKSVAEYNAIFEAQALTYLRMTGLAVALVINFGAATVKEGVHRVVNGFKG